jgi:Domain of unknown function (DUF4260)
LDEGQQFGPAFQDARSKLYRSEYGLISVVILIFLGWRYFQTPSLFFILEIIFWAIFPDLASFIPIGLSSNKRAWPRWGALVYNFFHTILVWALVFVIAFLIFKTPRWELLGWLAHISADRAVGYGLREQKNKVGTG